MIFSFISQVWDVSTITTKLRMRQHNYSQFQVDPQPPIESIESQQCKAAPGPLRQPISWWVQVQEAVMHTTMLPPAPIRQDFTLHGTAPMCHRWVQTGVNKISTDLRETRQRSVKAPTRNTVPGSHFHWRNSLWWPLTITIHWNNVMIYWIFHSSVLFFEHVEFVSVQEFL